MENQNYILANLLPPLLCVGCLANIRISFQATRMQSVKIERTRGRAYAWQQRKLTMCQLQKAKAIAASMGNWRKQVTVTDTGNDRFYFKILTSY